MPLAQEGEKSIKVAFYPLWDSTLRLLGRFIRMQTGERKEKNGWGKDHCFCPVPTKSNI